MKPIITYLLLAAAVIVAAICAWNWYSERQDRREAEKLLSEHVRQFDEHSRIVTDANARVLDSIHKENTVLATAVQKYKAKADSLEEVQAGIINEAKNLRDEIHSTPDSGQLALLLRLLSEHRATPVARD